MPTPQELEKQFWKSLKSDMTMMLGLVGVDQSHARPMTAARRRRRELVLHCEGHGARAGARQRAAARLRDVGNLLRFACPAKPEGRRWVGEGVAEGDG